MTSQRERRRLRLVASVPAPPASETRRVPQMLPIVRIVTRTDHRTGADRFARLLANADARALGVERRSDCARYAACLRAVPAGAVDALCPRGCAAYDVDPLETHDGRLLVATVSREGAW